MAALSIVVGVQEYIQAMVDRIPGMKVLLLDEETLGIISMVYSQSDILQHEVFLTERLDAETFASQEKMRHMNAVCFLRPENKNFLKLSQELKNPKYNEYHLFFTNSVPHVRLEALAACDEHELVKQVQEFFADVYAINHDLFSLNLESTVRLTEDQSRWTSFHEKLFDRIIEGLLATCFTLRMLPAIRYTGSCDLTRKLAHQLQTRIHEEQSLFDGIMKAQKGEPTPVLLLFDRRNDPVTPLLQQWTYQAMVHEILKLSNNLVELKKGTAAPGGQQEVEKIVMSPLQDQFFTDNLYSNFGDLGVNIRKYVEKYQNETKNTAKIESIEEMQRFVDEYPEFRRMSGNVSKHVNVVSELSNQIEAHALLEASQLEQELACAENLKEHYKALVELLQMPKITRMEGLRLVLLFALRYENEHHSIAQLKEQLRIKGVGEDQMGLGLIDLLLRHAGSQVRNSDLFQNKSFLQLAKSTLTNSFKGVENVYTQHKSHISTVVDSLMKGRLKETCYPYMQSKGGTTVGKDPPRRAVIFVVGGCTYEEARDVAELNKLAEGSFRPWLDPKPDPDFPGNEVSFTASIECRCHDDFLQHVAFNFTWFSDGGEIAAPVATGPLAAESWQKVGEPELVPEEPIDAVAATVEGGEEKPEGDAEEKPQHFIEGRAFESASPSLKAGCPFVRSLAVQALRIKAFYPDPTKPLPQAGSLPSPPGTAAGGKKDAKKDAKKDPKKKKDQPGDADPEEASYVEVDLMLPLAPLIVQKGAGLISQDFLAQLPCPGLKEFKVEVRSSGPLLSPEIRKHLNPLLITVGGAHQLPEERDLQQPLAYTVLEAFGERRRTAPLAIGAKGDVPCQAHLVYFLGTWPQHQTREYLQLARLQVEVHDRDKAILLPPAEEPPPSAPTSEKDAKKKPQSAPGTAETPSKPVLPPGWEPLDVRPVQEMWYGLATFCLTDLLNPRLNHPLHMRADVEPKSKRSQGGSRNLKVAQLLQGPEARQLLASVEKAEFQAMPRYLDGTWVRLSATLAEPLAEKVEAEEPAAEAEAPEAKSEEKSHQRRGMSGLPGWWWSLTTERPQS
ncbi:unnamed protein product [Effrenium voratum]|nr:unnamed protein product [Effrenium voratum]